MLTEGTLTSTQGNSCGSSAQGRGSASVESSFSSSPLPEDTGASRADEHVDAAADEIRSISALKPLGVALLGLGSYASERLAPGLQLTKHCKLVGIITGSPWKVQVWRDKYGIKASNVYSYDTLGSIADNPEIDVVYVVTPTALHPRFAIAAAAAGKHVWCEKPMAVSADDCQAMIDACRKHRVYLNIGYRMQHEPNTQTVMAYAKTKPYGQIRSVEAAAGNDGGGGDNWRMSKAMGGGAIYDMGVYTVNALRYATGAEPIRVVRAHQRIDRPEVIKEVDETTEFELEFPGGIIGRGKTSVGRDMNALRVNCEHGSYHLEPMQTYDNVVGSTSDGIKLDKTVEHQQAKQMDDDALAIIQKNAPLVPGEEGQRDIRIVQAIIECAQTAKPVDLRS
jgi:glucose-fructose oxidoreductase